MGLIAENLARVKAEIERAAAASGRSPGSVKLVAVSKTKPADAIREAMEAGQLDFGENYAQELRDKMNEIDDPEIKWHFIGHLQKNKVKYVAGKAAEVHSIDTVEIASELGKRAARDGRLVRGYLEVNLGEEDTKSGASIAEAEKAVKKISEIDGVELIGLMTMPPYFDDPEMVRPYYRKLRELRDAIRAKLGNKDMLPELSMGLSHDFRVAIEEGATRVRVGTAIFGSR